MINKKIQKDIKRKFCLATKQFSKDVSPEIEEEIQNKKIIAIETIIANLNKENLSSLTEEEIESSVSKIADDALDNI